MFCPREMPPHLNWLVDTGKTLTTKDGLRVSVLEFRHQPDAAVLSQWAKHFRNHYCADEIIDQLRDGTGLSRADYLTKLKFPDPKEKPGPSIRAGDFAEILVADFVQFVIKCWVPRTRYDNKTIRNESTKGSDIVGMRFKIEGRQSPDDTLFLFESKAQLSGDAAKEILQKAIDGSMKDELRKAESLNAIKQRFIEQKRDDDSKRVARFQNPEDNPYHSRYGAAALFTSEAFDPDIVPQADATNHPHRNALSVFVISGPKLMELVHNLYSIAANEA